MRTSLGLAFALSLSVGCSATGNRTGFVGNDNTSGADMTAGFAPVDFAMAGSPEDMAMDNSGTDDAFIDPCLERAKLIYTVDDKNALYSFKPDTLTFTRIGVLNCPAGFLDTPFSMGVDRNANAYVLYSSGDLFQVDTQTANCKATNFVGGQLGFDQFGMGFVADNPGAHTEQLYIAGLSNQQLGVIDPKSLKVANVGALNGNPELTGTGSAQLWGFFPDDIAPRVAQIDKVTAQEGKTYPLNGLAGTPSAWAFAFWGGDFWIFLQTDQDLSTHVYHLNAQTGKVTDVVPASGYRIVGAGVSICAPTTSLPH